MRYEIKIPILFLDMNNIKNKFLRIKNLNRHYQDRFIPQFILILMIYNLQIIILKVSVKI